MICAVRTSSTVQKIFCPSLRPTDRPSVRPTKNWFFLPRVIGRERSERRRERETERERDGERERETERGRNTRIFLGG